MSETKTLGEARVRTDFNVSNSDVVAEIKTKGAELINLIDGLIAPEDFPKDKLGEYVRIKSLAMTEIESGTSWAVKAATTKKDTF
jgi:methyl coenzyme M reductase subunit C